MADDPIKLGMVAHGDNPSTGRLSQGTELGTELEASLGTWQDPVSKNRKKRGGGGGGVQF